jgi:outer membrane protein OmpA-like peptidoglycan-associated protein
VKVASFVLCLFVAGHAYADDVQLQVRDRVPAGERPSVRVTARTEVDLIQVKLQRSDGQKVSLESKVPAGETVDLTWSQPSGTFAYKGEAQVTYRNGTSSKILLDFSVTVVGELAVQVAQGGYSPAKRLVRFTGSRPLQKATIELLDKDGKSLGKVERLLDDPKLGRYEARWEQQESGEIGRVVLTAHDRDGFWARVEITPFSIFIPHDEVVFASGSALIRPSERPKLDATLERIHDALRRNAEIEDVRLYVAGYTDTVSGREYNYKLSRRRAQSIAGYFRRKGLKIPVFYQGFGKDVLAVPTPDNTPEEKNRRALYLLCNHTPPPSKPFPRSEWLPSR